MERDCDRIDRLQSECKKHEGQIRDLSSRIVSSYTKTLKQAIEEQGVLQKKFDTVRYDCKILDHDFNSTPLSQL